ncbi:hypothetical protein LIER_17621 [Lithospermum erythrorhizon]|uniref:Reverse transcriptase RNase H-like domain-containing protein n=1 Tax=Lithospermum erythrorhizon TaxID=34254 RepID=A0AAV3QGH7_LITER
MSGNQLEVRTVKKGEEEDNSPKEKENKKRPIPYEEIVEVPFNLAVEDRAFKIGMRLDDAHRKALILLIGEFEDVFVWGPEDMPGIDPEVAMHRLHVDSMSVPIKQRKRTFSDEKNMVIRTEVEALLKARVIHELQFPEWIANVVLVKKSNNKWISEGAISSMMVRETEGAQNPIYYVSHVLHGVEENYPTIDKFTFAVLISSRKLKIYFEAHQDDHRPTPKEDLGESSPLRVTHNTGN